MVKGISMGCLGLWVAGNTVWHATHGTLPAAEVMGIVGVAALIANGGVALMLYRYRRGDSTRLGVVAEELVGKVFDQSLRGTMSERQGKSCAGFYIASV